MSEPTPTPTDDADEAPVAEPGKDMILALTFIFAIGCCAVFYNESPSRLRSDVASRSLSENQAWLEDALLEARILARRAELRDGASAETRASWLALSFEAYGRAFERAERLRNDPRLESGSPAAESLTEILKAGATEASVVLYSNPQRPVEDIRAEVQRRLAEARAAYERWRAVFEDPRPELRARAHARAKDHYHVLLGILEQLRHDDRLADGSGNEREFRDELLKAAHEDANVALHDLTMRGPEAGGPKAPEGSEEG